MRILLAFLVMWWIVNLIMALAARDPLGIRFGVIYLAACAYGVFARGWFLGIFCWIGIGVALEALTLLGAHTTVPALTLLIVMFWSGLAILAGNLFRTD